MVENWANNPNNPLLDEPVRNDETLKTANNTLPLESERKAELAERTDNPDELTKLGQNKKDRYDGDFLMNMKDDIAKRGDFTHVHTHWQGQCISYDDGRKVLANQQSDINDIKVALRHWEVAIDDNDKVGLRYKPTGRIYIPTKHAMTAISQIGKGSSWALHDLTHDKAKTNDEDDIIWERDREDAEVAANYLRLLLFREDRVDQDKVRLFRTWDNNGTLRAVLSDDYTIINNGWFLDTIVKLIPNGLLSHWRGDADEIYGNVLIPDTIRAESDSDYGGMLSIGNSEIGTRRITSVPSVFRAICMNGCIWDHEQGKGVDQVHRKKSGKVDYTELAQRIKVNLEKQIPLIDQAMRMVLSSRDLSTKPANILQAITQVCKELKLTKKQSKGVIVAYRVEANILGNLAQTCFGVANAVTRFGQSLSNREWVALDTAAGNLIRTKRDKWETMMNRAAKLDDKDIVKVFGRDFDGSAV